MPRLRRYVIIVLVLQLAMVLLGQVSDPIFKLSGVFGMGIPLVAGWLYSARKPLTFKDASVGGLLIGAAGAAVALVVAIVLKGGLWSLLPLGTLASAFTAWVGAMLGWSFHGLRKGAAAE